MGEKPSSPDSVAFFERFVGEGFGIRGLLWFRSGFILSVISIFYEGGEWSSPTGVYPPDVLLLLGSLLLFLSLTASAAAWEASGHLDRSGAEVDLRVVLAEPREAKDHALLSQLGNCQQ